jgi:hypothetical protein
MKALIAPCTDPIQSISQFHNLSVRVSCQSPAMHYTGLAIMFIILYVPSKMGRPRCRWVDNIKMDLRERGWNSMDWIDLARDRD